MRTDEINIRDPFVLVHEGKYYLYGTRGATCWGPATGFDVYFGDDLENWSAPVPCFENDAIAVPAIMKRGIPVEDARNYCIIGCVEPACCGNDFANSGGDGNAAYTIRRTHCGWRSTTA